MLACKPILVKVIVSNDKANVTSFRWLIFKTVDEPGLFVVRKVVNSNIPFATSYAVGQPAAVLPRPYQAFSYIFGTIKAVFGFKIKLHVEGYGLMVVLFGQLCYLLAHFFLFCQPKYADGFIVKRLSKLKQGFSFYFLVGIEFATNGMVHK